MNNEKRITVALAIYHFVFTIIAFNYFCKKGGDATTYWGQFSGFIADSWLNNFGFSTSFIIFLNYPFIKLGVPIEIGFILYSMIGLLGLRYFVKWIVELNQLYKLNTLGWFFVVFAVFSPNLHFWTSLLGKEPLIFLCLSVFAWSSLQLNNRKYHALLALIGVFIIRPHLFLMISIAVFLSMIIYKRKIIFNKFFLLIGIFVTVSAFYITLQLTKIRYLNWERIKKFNAFSLESFRNSEAFVPMDEMNYFEKCFAFLFRPLFEKVPFGLISLATIENLILLIAVLITIIIVIFKKSIFFIPKFTFFIIIFTLICSAFYIERYANWGIFMRTKIQFVPFLIVALASWVSIDISKNNTN